MTQQINNYEPDRSAIVESEDYKKQQEANKKAQNQKLSFGQRFMAFFKKGQTRLAFGLILIVIGVILLIAFLSFIFKGSVDESIVENHGVLDEVALTQVQNSGGSLGANLANNLIKHGFGLAAFVIVIWAFIIGLRLVKKNTKVHFYSFTLISIFSLFVFSIIIDAITSPLNTAFHLGGDVGYYLNHTLKGLVGTPGMIAIDILIGALWVMLCYKTLKNIWTNIKNNLPKPKKFNGENVDENENQTTQLSTFRGEAPAQNTAATSKPERRRNENNKPKNNDNPSNVQESVATQMNAIKRASKVSNPGDPTGEYMHYVFPSLDLLPDIKLRVDSVDKEEQDANKARIRETLRNYGIEIKQIEVHVGPTITLFEIVPQDGVRISKIRNLEDDIALSLAALGIRIIAPMPGRGTIGIEVPNREPQTVPMRAVLASETFQNTKAKLPMILGCTVSNEVYIADLTKMPHLLVAGATGQGKSVGLNCIIASLLFKKGPSELKIVLIDPKKVEFSLYADLDKYFLAHVPNIDHSIINNPEETVTTLNSLVQEMENRYKVLEEVKERNIEDYNKKWRESLRHDLDERGDHKYQFMPYIVVVVDEFADLIMIGGKAVETPIVRIAQKARAVGIHMIIATQRPSVNVITGLIKANFPGRIAFRVAQMTDSKTIIDRSGAQQLIGRGDMLFMANGETERLQCPFIDTPEVEKICKFIKEQEDNDIDINHERPFLLPEYFGDSSNDSIGDSYANSSAGDMDPLFKEIASMIVLSDTASTSWIQRKFNLGYNRAGRIMDQMEAAGIVGPANGGKPRRVLMSPAEVEQLFS